MTYLASSVKLQTQAPIPRIVVQHRVRLGSGVRYTVRNTIAIIMAKPARSVGKNTVPSMRALVMVAETGSMVPMRLARTEPIS